MNARELVEMGIPKDLLKISFKILASAASMGFTKEQLAQAMSRVATEPASCKDDPLLGTLATAILEYDRDRVRYQARSKLAPYHIWGSEIEPAAVQQLKNACSLPVSVSGALMPDAHLGYGLPIGGVLATEGCVVPYAVGMDIACRMKLSVYDVPLSDLQQKREYFVQAIEAETRFGIGSGFRDRRQHQVMDENWNTTALIKELKDRAWKQLGSSGSGNHFVEFGELLIDSDELGPVPGRYLALLSHSGSRGTGGKLAAYYSRIAKEKHPELPKELSRLAWLDMTSQAGQEYWLSMELMGRYAAANHELIHKHIAGNLGIEPLLEVENHHNFAWKETHFGKEVIVHRKGATPAGPDDLGIIPGSMGTAGYVVRGKGNSKSLNSASHGAGRKMSRTAARKAYTWEDGKKFLKDRGVSLISAGLDEVPMAYKDIETVMEEQEDLVEKLAVFNPRLVKMANDK